MLYQILPLVILASLTYSVDVDKKVFNMSFKQVHLAVYIIDKEIRIIV